MELPKRKQTARTERIGVGAVHQIVEAEMGWIFREQPVSDYGVDAHIEIVDNESVTGRLLGAQIKSGPSYFRQPCPEGWIYRGDLEHLDYYLRHTLPVVVVLHDPESGACYWQAVRSETVEKTDKGWKMVVPSENTLGMVAKESLRAMVGLTEGSQTLPSIEAPFRMVPETALPAVPSAPADTRLDAYMSQMRDRRGRGS